MDKIPENSKLLSTFTNPIVLLLAFAYMIFISWRKLTDLLIDFGRELYIPWQITNGQLLYRDLAHIYGPFSSYFKALVFYIFGASITVLLITNIITLSLLLFVIYKYTCDVSSRLAAFASCAVIIFAYAFAQYSFAGNYNFASPYAHEAVHGITLSALMLYGLHKYSSNDRFYLIFFSGLSLGFVFLTKFEIFISAFASVFVFFYLQARTRKIYLKTIKAVGIFFMAATIPIVGFFFYLYSAMPLAEASSGIINMRLLTNRDIIGNKFYTDGMGFNNIYENIKIISIHTLVVLFIIAAILLLSHYYIKYRSVLLVKFLCITCFTAIIVTSGLIDPATAGRSLPVLCAISLLALLYHFKSTAIDTNLKINLISLISWAVFSSFLLAKILLNCRIYHYGFYLTPPASVLIIIMLLFYIPIFANKIFMGVHIYRRVMIIIIISIVGQYFFITKCFYDIKSFEIGSGANKVITSNRNIDLNPYFLNMAITWINLNVGKEDTLLVLPEGVSINFLTKRINPTKYSNFMLPEIILYGEDNIIRDFVKSVPDYIVLVNRSTSEYGFSDFGIDPMYGRKIMEWVRDNYEMVRLFGGEPLTGRTFGITIMKSKRLTRQV